MNKRTISRSHGFTLIEILVVVALIAILAAIAMPAYNNYINRGKLKTAQADLVALSLNLENEYQRKLAYPSGTDAVNANTAAVIGKYDGWSPAAEDDFEYSTAADGGTGYEVKATGKNGGVNNCVLTLDDKGNRESASCPYGNGGWL